MSTDANLAWALADTASACFTQEDRMSVYTALGAGESYSAIVRILAITVRARHSLPANLITELAAWLDGCTGNEYEPRIRSLLNTYTPRPGTA
jgi:hypothetical protein